MKFVSLLVLSLFLAVGIFAQKESVTAEIIFPGEWAKVDKLPMPDYPGIAKKTGLGGRVGVDVVLDKKGSVISADNADGPYPICQSDTEPSVLALRNAALAAARRARFRVDAQWSHGMSGRIIYDFVTDRSSDIGGGVTGGHQKSGDRLTVVGTTDPDTGARIQSDDKVAVGNNSEHPPKTISGGVLNGKATHLAKPAYPPAARAVRAGGPVVVRVIINEEGKIYSAEALTGHPLLRHASEAAACETSFTPTLLMGKPVKVMGVITYNYVAP